MGDQIDEASRSLSGLRVFSGIPTAILAKISNYCAWHQIAASGVVVQSDSTRPRGVYFLVKGIVEVLRPGCDDQLIAVVELEAPECFDDLDLISGKAGPASVRARTDCVLAEMPGDRFHSFLRACPCVSPDLLDNIVSIADILGDKPDLPRPISQQ